MSGWIRSAGGVVVAIRVQRLAMALLALLAVSSMSTEARADLQQAYQREFAFLEAERNALKARLKNLDAELKTKVAAARAEVDQLQGGSLGLSLQAESMEESLSDVEREVDNAAEGADLIESLFSQSLNTLEKGGIKLPERTEITGDSADAEQARREVEVKNLEFIFSQALPLLNQYSSVRKVEGTYFAETGTKIQGQIVHLGRVSAFGVSDSVSGALAPAGAGALKIWPGVQTAGTAAALAAGEQPANLSLFLYESLDKGVEKRKDKTAVEVIESGGVIGWVIVGLGGLALLMALMRALLLWRAAANTHKLVEEISPLVEEKKLSKAEKICDNAKSAGGRVLVATLRNLHRDRQELEDIVSEAVLHEQPALDRFGAMIMVVAAVAPLLGLLGTVTGMIATFDIITQYGTGNPKLLSGGIAIALVTTELGLLVAIPSLILGNMLGSWAESIKDGIDKSALRVTNIATGVKLTERPSVAPVSVAETAPAE